MYTIYAQLAFSHLYSQLFVHPYYVHGGYVILSRVKLLGFDGGWRDGGKGGGPRQSVVRSTTNFLVGYILEGVFKIFLY